MKNKRSGLGWKVTAVFLFLVCVAAAAAGAVGTALMLSDGYGQEGTYYDSYLCREEIENYQSLAVATLRRQRELSNGDLTYLEVQRVQQQLDSLLEQLDSQNTNFRYQLKSYDGSQVLLTNLEEGQTLDQVTAKRWYAAVNVLGDAYSLQQTNVGDYHFNGSYFQFDYESSASTWDSGAALPGGMSAEEYMRAYAEIFEQVYGFPMDDALYFSMLEQLVLQEGQGRQTEVLVLECGLTQTLQAEDPFREGSRTFEQAQMLLPWLVLAVAAAALIAVVCLVYLCAAAGTHPGVDGVVLNVQDRIWYDVYLLGVLGLGLLLAHALDGTYWWSDNALTALAQMVVVAVLPITVLVLALILTTATRLKAGVLLKHTLVGQTLRLGRWFLQMLPVTWRLVFVFICYLLLGVLFWGMMGPGFLLPMALVSTAILLCLCWWQVHFQRLRRGGEALAAGDLDYRVDTAHMPADLRRHGEDLNNISNGMAHAVQEQMKSERFKAELITNVSHDLKTPLTSIINYVDLLKKTDIQDPTALEYIQVLDKKSQRLKKLTEDLVEASKASTGTLAVNREKLGMIQLINQALGEYGEKLDDRRLQVVTTLPEGEVYVHADGRHLWRVLDNLLSNCVKYALEGTRVYIELQRGRGQIILSVKNISRDALNVAPEQLMERFVRGDQSRTTEGSGLGLSIARSLTELQGGVFDVSVDGDLFKATVSLPQMV